MEDVSVGVGGDATINVWYRAAAPGSKTVVLIHGLTGTSRLWIPLLDELPPHLGVIAPDLRGRGASWRTQPPYDLETLASDVGGVVDQLGPDSVIGVGYSMGAWILALLAGPNTETVDHAVLLDGGIPVTVDPKLTPEEILDTMVGPSVRRLSESYRDVHSYLEYHRAWPTLSGRWNPLIDEVLEYDLVSDTNGLRVRANPEAVRVGGYDITLNRDITTAGHRIGVPATLVVVDHGMTDEPGGFVAENGAQEASALNPLLTTRLLKGLNHDTLVLGDGVPIIASIISGL